MVETEIYLIPDLTYQLCQSVAPTAEHQLKVSAGVLWRLLDEAGLLVSTSTAAGRGRTTCQQFDYQRHEVIHLQAELLLDLNHSEQLVTQGLAISFNGNTRGAGISVVLQTVAPAL